MLAHKYSFDAIGTKWTIESESVITDQLKGSIQKTIRKFDDDYSRFKPESVVSKLAQSGGAHAFPEVHSKMFRVYQTLNQLSDGAISPLIGNSLESLGYDSGYSLEFKKYLPGPNLEGTVKISGSKVTLDNPALIDIGAVGKGLLVDEISSLIEPTSSKFAVDASGDIHVSKGHKERIGLENPNDPSQIIGYVDVSGQSICASATNRRAWSKGIHHVIDARNGKPVTGIKATWAIADTTLMADALSTAFFFIRPEKLTSSFGEFSYIIVSDSGSIEYNQNIQGRIFDETNS